MEEKNRKERETGREEEELRNLAQDIEIPTSLEPKVIEKMLRERNKKRGDIKKYVGLAAGVFILCGVSAAGIMINSGFQPVDSYKSVAEEGRMLEADDYDEIYALIQQNQQNPGGQARMALNVSETAQYSETNVRESGIGEGDRVKTDGENLYILNDQTVHIVAAGDEEMLTLSKISYEADQYVKEIYVEGNRLAVFYTRMEVSNGDENTDSYYRQFACTDIYDIRDPSSPDKIDTISQSGNYSTMRVSGEYLYVLSEFSVSGAVARADAGTYIPEVQGKIIDAGDIYMPQGKTTGSYTVITAFSLEDPEEKCESRAVFGSGGICYVSEQNIYIAESIYEEDKVPVTSIRKISYGDGQITGVAQTQIDGTLNDSFCIDEYEGYLRIIATVEPAGINDGIMPLEQTPETGGEIGVNEAVNVDQNEATQKVSSTLYVLDGNLQQAGAIRDLAEEEYVYSARFMGDVGYFVTFKQVDPLFSVDLSVPEKPEIVGQLKIPGFSEYLHPYGEGKLVGIGMSLDEEGTIVEGVKLSMFDITDPSDVKEADSYVLENTYGSDALYNYKEVLANTQKNLLGFSAYGDETGYYIFSYSEEDGFSQVFSRQFAGYYDARGLYTGERFYLIADNTVESYSLGDFKKINDIVL